MPRQADVRFFFRLTEGPELEVVRFELTEGVSQPFRLALELASGDDAVDAATMLDREATLTIERAGAVERRVVGIVTAFEQAETGFRRTRYRAVVESPLARLALRHNSRIFQQVTATDILGKLLKENRIIGTRASYSASHEPREYCVQYRETDATFFHRLATEEGIVHWHDTREGRDALVLSDRIDSAPRLEDHDAVVYQPQPAGDAPRPHLWRFAHRRQLAPTRITQREYTFHNPHYDLQQEARAFASEQAVGDYEHYDYAARYKRDEAGKQSMLAAAYFARIGATAALLSSQGLTTFAQASAYLAWRAQGATTTVSRGIFTWFADRSAQMAANRALMLLLGRVAFWAGAVVTIGTVALMVLDDDALEKWCDRCCYRLRNDIKPYRTLEEDLGALLGATEDVA